MSGETDLALRRRPPGDGPRFIPIVRAPEQGTLSVVSLSLDLFALDLHWTGRHLLPCTLPGGECIGCDHKQPLKWRGYLGVWFPQSDRLGILELPEAAVRECPELEEGLLPDLRGYHLHVYRRTPNKRGLVIVTFAGQVDRNLELPRPFDVQASLRRVWYGGRRREEGRP